MGVIGSPKYQRTIADMAVGEEGYAVSWALGFDLKDIPYLNTGMSIHGKPGGTVQLSIKRTGPGPADYSINIQEVDYEWKQGKNPFMGVVGVDTSRIVRLDYTPSELPSLEDGDTDDIISDLESWLDNES